ncbi:interferon-induced protein 44-like [Erpetoichthys calabaricus]|uniref:Interferon-induced protein 44-like n=1 Tax=Erpetoichthys calabaricus TaxID=27687 RepID=A0A8C4SXL6_ERPCA|nr:interferon-induced protein 44-like [Erpetoichthys calabaricus]
MARVTSSLSKAELELLQIFPEPVTFCLLYKASVHGYTAAAFHSKCDNQGPTLTVGFNNSGFVFGGYINRSYAQTGGYLADEKAFLFSFKRAEPQIKPLHIAVTNAANAFYDAANSGPNFGTNLVFLSNDGATIVSNPGEVYAFDGLALCGNDLNLTECEVYRVEPTGDILEKPWRTVQWGLEKKAQMMDFIRSYKPPINSVTQARILLIGPIGAGKSSFFNSINSTFRGHVTSQAIAGSSVSSLTKKFRTYSIKSGREGKLLPIILCDTMGLEETNNSGMDLEDICSIVNGHIPDRYQFNPSAPIQADTPGYIKAVQLKDKIHCVAFVIDACKVKLMSARMEEKLQAVRSKLNLLSVPQLVLLTKVDEACPVVAEDITNVYRSRFIQQKIHEVAARIGIPISCVVPVRNYSIDVDLDDNTDALLLNTVVQMLRFADNFFDDFGDVGYD